jgi:hypothetical protein
LDIAGAYGAAVSHTISMLDGPREDISDRLYPSVRMPGKPRQIILRDVIAKIIE